MRRIARHFRRFLRRRRRALGGFVCIPVVQLAEIGMTILIGDGIDRLQREESADFLLGLCGLLVAVALFRGVARFFLRYWLTTISHEVEVELKQSLFDKLTRLPFAFHDKHRTGDLVSRISSDVEVLRTFLGPGLMYGGGALIVVPVGVGVLISIHPLLGTCMILPLMLIAVTMKVLAPRMHAASTAVQESVADITSCAQESFGGVRVVKGYGREEYEARRFAEASERNLENQVRVAKARGLAHAGAHVADDLTFFTILLIGGLALIDRDLAAGDLFKFIDLTTHVFWPMLALGWVAGMYPRALASTERIDELLEEQEEEDHAAEGEGAAAPAELRGELTFEGVGFTYPGAATPALSGVNAHVPAGTRLGVVGPTGSGKSTLLALIGRLYQPDGVLRVDGLDARTVPVSTLRAALGYVPQEGFLFSDTWRNNVGFGVDAPLDDDTCWRLARQAAIEQEVRDLPGGLDQRIGERGVTLSGGQRQRTCLARALARDPKVLLLDDCLSAVDTETEAALLTQIEAAGRGRTVVIAAHRLRAVAGARHILVLAADGSVADQGTHEELLGRGGWYARTWRRQEAWEELTRS